MKLNQLKSGLKGLFAVAAAAFGLSVGADELPFGPDLASGSYVFTDSLDYTAPAGESALKVADGANVTLCIPAGVTVTLKGGNATGTTGAGAGIEVPKGATLNIIGEGALNATGGDAADGANGGQGSTNAGYNDGGHDIMYSGAGGNGGNGGGGAGAGIGGAGGNGGNGGEGAASCKASYDKNNGLQAAVTGTAGGVGGNGGNGGTCGTVNVGGTVQITAKGGAEGEGSLGGARSAFYHDDKEHNYYYAGYAGGGGGGGGAGAAAEDIGGGGAGGAGGGGGGSGAIIWFGTEYKVYSEDGDGLGGAGGQSAVQNGGGADGKSARGEDCKTYKRGSQNDDKNDDGGKGGSGGAAGQSGTKTEPGTLSSPGTVNDVDVLKCAFPGCIYDVASKTVRIVKNGQWAVAGDVKLDSETGAFRPVTISGFAAGKTLAVTGLDGVDALMTDADGVIRGLYLRDGDYVLTIDGVLCTFTVDQAPLSVAVEMHVPYCTFEGGVLVEAETNAILVTAGTRFFADGAWYVVTGAVTTASLEVRGAVDFILADGAELTVNGGIGVDSGKSFAIYGQTLGTGRLAATGAFRCAGIGGRNPLYRGGYGNCGKVTINGGTVTASGGGHASGIGGGDLGAGGTVMVNGGTVTANGGEYGAAGIGGGGHGGAGGEVTINGGTVTAMGGDGSAGIGGGWYVAGGTVTINGGRVNAIANNGASRIGRGADGRDDGTIEISGGVFAWKVSDDWCAEGHGVFDNPDPVSATDYPWTVVPSVTVTVGKLPDHVTSAAWTGGDGSVTNAVEGDSFKVQKGMENVKVLFTPDELFALDKMEVALDSPLSEDYAFEQDDLPTAYAGEYVNADGQVQTNGTVTVLTAEMNRLTTGWYLVVGTIERGGLDVTSGNQVNLILADGASLTVTGSYTHAGIDVRPGESLTIYGQRDGTGRLMSTGGNWAAGIGGGDSGAGGDSGVCGTVTINGGTVTAQGGVAGAGIGGGYRGMGGTVTINGGTVTATGGSDGAGIGVRDGYEGAGIGGGGYGGAGGTVTINGGMVNAIAGERAARIGHGESGSDDGTIEISGGVFAWKVSDDWCKKGTDIGIVPNLDPATRADYPWAALPSVTVTVGEIPNYVTSVWTFGDGTVTNAVEGDSFKVLRGTESVKVIFTLDPAYESVSGRWVAVQDLGMVNEDIRLPELPASRHRAVEYVDADGKVKTNDTFSVVTAEMDELSSGWWLVEDSLSFGDLYIAEGHEVHLILADGASLTATAGEEHAGIRARGATLVIYGQRDGSGILTANGGDRAAGIGGGFYEAGGTVTINGGTVTATGGKFGAGIGGGWAAGGTVTINGGTVTATGGSEGAGIGGGAGRAGGTVMINGGTVTAKGGDRAAGIGGGMYGAGDTVTINGGRVNAIAGESATRIGCGAYVSDDGTIEISGGVFAWEVTDSMCAIGYCVVANSDPATTMDYPWTVVPSAMVTIGGLSDHATAVWTSGDGTVTNAVKNGAFAVLKGTENVKVIFTADPGYSFAGGAVVVEVSVGRVDGDCSVAAAPETQKSEIETFGSGWYVTATNGAYVDTGLNARSDTKIVADMQALDLKGQCGFFGTIGGDMNLAAYINGWNPGQVATCLGKEADWTASDVNADTARHLFVLDANNNGSFTIDGANANCRTGNVTAGSESTYPILVGARNNEGTADTMNCRIFSFQIYEGTELKRDLVPARMKDAGQVVGLYDMVSGEFFGPRGGALTLDHDDSIALASFCDYDANSGSFTNAVRYCTVVTSETRTFEDGQWYVVADDVEISNGENITVSGAAHLVLCDGASLTVGNVGGSKAAIGVSARNSLTIYGQENGSGLLTATGGQDGAGIGGGGYGGAGGTVTINGGSVTATGGQNGAGIGGGYLGAGGTVTINGGIVTATGGGLGAGIGGGFNEAGGTVTINGGKVSAIAGQLATRIGRGASGRNDGTIEISGGVFAWKVSDDWCAEGHGVFDNPDPVSATDYPWTVVPSAMVAIGGLSGHETAVWTSGDGTATNAVKNGAFAVVKATENVKVIFTADPGYSFAGGAITAEVLVGRVDEDVPVTAPETQMSEIETFGSGWYVTATNGVYVDTLFKPGSNTRVEMDVNVGDPSKREYWFGCWTNDWNKGAFALGNDANNEVYCGYGSGDSCGGIPGIIPSGRVTVALEKGIVYTNGVVWSDKQSDAAFSLDQNLYLFAQNRKGTPAPGDGQERIVCYGCKISTNDVNGVAVPVRNLVPARTKDAGQVVGLYDTVSGEFFAPRGGALTLGHDEDAAVSVTPGEPLVFDAAAEATNAAKNAVLTPRSDVEAKLGKGSDELETYCNMFGFDVVPTSDGKWAVEAGLMPEAWTNVVESAQAATRQIPVADIAALPMGTPTNVTVEGCVPGFYYTIYGGSAVTNLKAFVSEKSRNVLCGTDGKVTFSEVVKPSAAAGFFTIGVKETPGVQPSDGHRRLPIIVPPVLPQ